MRAQGSAGPQRVRLPEFLAGDALRGLGVLGVVGFHVAFYALYLPQVLTRHPGGAGHRTEFELLGGHAIGTLIETGGYALAVFFALSGYLISRPFVFAVVRGQPLPRLSSFARNRFLRIVPAFWVVFTVLLIIYGTKGASTRQIFSAYAFVEGWNDNPLSLIIGQAWSLRAEALFYVLVPITAWLFFLGMGRLQASLRVRTAIALAFPLAVAGAVIWMNSWWDTERTNPVTVLYTFMAGVIFAVLETFLPARVELFGRRHRTTTWAASTAVAISGFVLLYGVQYFDPQSVELGGTVIFLGLIGIFGGALLLQWGTAGCWRLLDNRPLAWLGQRSYSIYLVHLVIVVELAPRFLRAFDDHYKQAFLALFAVSLLASVALGEILFRLVEAPFMNLKKGGWRSSERAAVFRRAAWWLPSRVLDRRRVTARAASQVAEQGADAQEPSGVPAARSSS